MTIETHLSPQTKTVDELLDQLESLCSNVLVENSETSRRHEEWERRYRRLEEAVSDYVYRIEFKDGVPQRTTHGCGCIEITGYAPEDFQAESDLWIRMVVEEDRPLVLEHARKIAAGDRPEPMEHRIRRKDGRIRWVRNLSVSHWDQEGKATLYEGLIRDVTREKEDQAALARLRELPKILLNCLPFMAYVADLESRQVLFANQALEEALGPAIGKICWQCIDPEQKEPCRFCSNDRTDTQGGSGEVLLPWKNKRVVRGKRMESYDRILSWIDGRAARLSIFLDVF
jgi:PAS domain S-box-containing protein